MKRQREDGLKFDTIHRDHYQSPKQFGTPRQGMKRAGGDRPRRKFPPAPSEEQVEPVVQRVKLLLLTQAWDEACTVVPYFVNEHRQATKHTIPVEHLIKHGLLVEDLVLMRMEGTVTTIGDLEVVTADSLESRRGAVGETRVKLFERVLDVVKAWEATL